MGIIVLMRWKCSRKNVVLTWIIKIVKWQCGVHRANWIDSGNVIIVETGCHRKCRCLERTASIWQVRCIEGCIWIIHAWSITIISICIWRIWHYIVADWLQICRNRHWEWTIYANRLWRILIRSIWVWSITR